VKGISHYQTKAGIHAVSVHYTADPAKDPDTDSGLTWFGEATKGYIGGTLSSAWREEMEVDWDVTGGELVFPMMQFFEDKIVAAPFEIPSDWQLYGSFDYGHRNPASFHVYAMDFDSNVWSVWELYGSEMGYVEMAEKIRACPYYDKLNFMPIADPSIFAQTQQSENEVKSIAQLFWELDDAKRIIFVPATKGGDVTTAEKIRNNLWEDLENKPAGWRIFSTCPWQIWELKKLRYADWSSTQMQFKNLREKIVDKDNHAWDDAKMFFNMFLWGPTSAPQDALSKLEKIDPMSAREWRAMAQRLGETQKPIGLGSMWEE